VSVRSEIVSGFSERVTLSADLAGSAMKQAVAAQKRRTSKARETTRAELELAFFCIAGEMGALVVAYGPERVNVFRSFPAGEAPP
jgi:hypothetical protein